MRARICQRWVLELPEPDPDDRWFLDWALESPGQAARHITAGYHALQSLRDLPIRTAFEYFGGIGGQALVIRELWPDAAHSLIELSPAAVQHLRRNGFNAHWADAYASLNPADLVALDFGDLTAWQLRPGLKHRELLDRVFFHGPKGVVLTDIAGRYLHLHGERYEQVLGRSCETYEGYLLGLGAWLNDQYGYRIWMGTWTRWSAVLALVPASWSPGKPGLILPTPEKPTGLELEP